MTEADRTELFEYRTELDWLCYVSRLRAIAADPTVDSSDTWTPSSDVVSGQRSRAKAARERAMASADDPRALWNEAVRPQTSGHITAFFDRLSLEQADLVHLFLPDETRQRTLWGGCDALLAALDRFLSALKTMCVDTSVRWSDTDEQETVASDAGSPDTRTVTLRRTDSCIEARANDSRGETVVERWPLREEQ